MSTIASSPRFLVLPGFEFTATLGFLFSCVFGNDFSTQDRAYSSRLNVPEEKLDIGSSEVGATTDVLQAYAKIAQEGGLVIAPPTPISSHGS